MTTVVLDPVQQTVSPRLLGWTRNAAYLLGIIVFVIMVAPIPVVDGSEPREPGKLDDGWKLAIQQAATENWHFGTQIAFTYGPLASIASPNFYSPNGFVGRIILSGVVAVLIAVAAALYAEQRGWTIRYWLLFIVIASLTVTMWRDCVATFPPAMLFAFYWAGRVDRRTPWVSMAILAVLCGVVMWVKHSIALIVLASVGAITLDLLARRRLPWPALVTVMAAVVAWFAAGQGVDNFLPYVKTAVQISAGYREMALVGATSHAFTLYWLIASAALLWMLRAWLVPLGRLSTLICLLAAAAVLFIFFKHGHIRRDPTHLIGSAVSLVAFNLAIFTAQPWRKPRPMWVWAVSMFALLSMTPIHSAIVDLPFVLARRAKAVINYSGGRSPGQIYYAWMQSDIAQNRPLPKLDGTVDVYCHRQAAVLPAGVDYHPRPVIQSYSVYTLPLAEMNAAFVDSPRAAKHVLFSVETIDERLPSQEDGLSWPQLLRWYDVRPTVTSGFAVLDRRSSPFSIRKSVILDTEFALGDSIALPDSGSRPTWLEIDIPRTAMRSAASLLYQDAYFWIETTDSVGNVRRHRLVTSTSAGGFFLSPLVLKSKDLVDLDRRIKGVASDARPVVRSIRINGTWPSPPGGRLRLSNVQLTPTP